MNGASVAARWMVKASCRNNPVVGGTAKKQTVRLSAILVEITDDETWYLIVGQTMAKTFSGRRSPTAGAITGALSCCLRQARRAQSFS